MVPLFKVPSNWWFRLVVRNLQEPGVQITKAPSHNSGAPDLMRNGHTIEARLIEDILEQNPYCVQYLPNPVSGTGYFRFDAGTLSLVGPAPLVQERTCVSGQARCQPNIGIGGYLQLCVARSTGHIHSHK